MNAIGYRRDIDGLRSVAVVPVVLGHAGVAGFAGGYVGVDIFFVISGFLITSILWREVEEGRYSIIGFYERRARRILPALFAVLAVVLSVGLVLLPPGPLMALAKSAVASVAFVSNGWFWKQADYFGPEAEFEPLLHTWSLAVEEQFYIVFPLLLWLLARWSRDRITVVIAGLCAVSLALSLWATEAYPAAAFYLLPTRAWELGIGALLALGAVPATHRAGVAEVVAALGLAAIVTAILLFDAETAFPGAAALLPCLGAGALIWAGGTHRTLAGRFLSLPPMVGIGLVSYSLYLWHWPVLVWLRMRLGTLDLSPLAVIAAVALSLALAWASWRFVEAPFRSRPPRGWGRGPIFAGSTAGIAVVAVAGMALVRLDGLPDRVPVQIRAIYDVAEEQDGGRSECRNLMPADGLCGIGVPDAPRDVLLWGDSHAGAILPGVDRALAQAGLGGSVSFRIACPPVLGVVRQDMGAWHRCAEFNAAVFEMLEASDAYPLVILAARWELVAEGARAPGEGGAPAVLASADGTGPPGGNFAVFAPAFERTVRALRNTGRTVLIVEDIPVIGWHVPNRLGDSLYLGAPLPEAPTRDEIEGRNARVTALIESVLDPPGIVSASVVPELCRPRCSVEQDGRPLYHDGNHLSRFGAETLILEVIAPHLTVSGR